jgi:hypothetical protein
MSHCGTLRDHSVAAIGLIVATLILQTGCASSTRNLDLAREAFAAGAVIDAHQSLAELADSGKRVSGPAKLDLAMTELASGNARAAESLLREMRDDVDALPKIAPLHELTSLVTDDQARVFRPAGYEEVMIRTMLAICSLASDQADAESYAIQATKRQSDLADEAQQRGLIETDKLFQPIAIAPYLRGILREATHHDYDDAARAYQLVSDVRPEFTPVHADIQRASGGVHSAPGHGVLYVIGCVGRGPVLEEGVAETTTTALSIASRAMAAMQSRDGEDRADVPALPNIASVKVPRLVLPPSNVAAIATVVDGQSVGATETLTDVAQLAANQMSAEMPWVIARAVGRRVTKEAMVAKAGQQMGLTGSSASIFQFAAASLWSGTEHADTRCWGMLPREIQSQRIELPAGSHQIQLLAVDRNGRPLSDGQTRQVQIVDGKNQYLVAIAPDGFVYLGND